VSEPQEYDNDGPLEELPAGQSPENDSGPVHYVVDSDSCQAADGQA
jgi:hypothetical protein